MWRLYVAHDEPTVLHAPSEITHVVEAWEKRKDLSQSYDKSPYTNRKFETAKWQHKNAT